MNNGATAQIVVASITLKADRASAALVEAGALVVVSVAACTWSAATHVVDASSSHLLFRETLTIVVHRGRTRRLTDILQSRKSIHAPPVRGCSHSEGSNSTAQVLRSHWDLAITVFL